MLSARDRYQYTRAESDARAKRRGLWKRKSPKPPWEYRKVQRQRGERTGSLWFNLIAVLARAVVISAIAICNALRGVAAAIVRRS